jgi:hypothetical protein
MTTKSEWNGKERRNTRLRFAKFSDIATILVILLGFITMIITIDNSLKQRTLSATIRHNQDCIVDLQRLDAEHAAELFAIGSDDRRAVDNYITRVSKDVAVGTRASILDIVKAYADYRAERIDNDKRRQDLGSGITVTNACQYTIKSGHPVSPLPSISVPASSATPDKKPSSSPAAGSPTVTVTNFNIPPAIIVGPTVTRTQVVPGPKVHVTVTVTRTVTASPSKGRGKPEVTITIRVPIPPLLTSATPTSKPCHPAKKC